MAQKCSLAERVRVDVCKHTDRSGGIPQSKMTRLQVLREFAVNRRSIRIVTIYGIELRLDYSWFILFGLIVLSFTTGILPVFYRQLSGAETVIVGVIAALLLFVSVVIHEFAHALYAKRTGLRINRITLFIFGGASELQDEPARPGQEFILAGLGPLSSLVLGIVFGGLWQLGRALDYVPLAALGGTLAMVNIALAVFNLLPGFPLDGGRLFRAAVWKLSGSLLTGTRAAATAGKVLALLLMAYGVLQIVNRGIVGGIWLLLIGFFLYRSAAAAYEQTLVYLVLKEVAVADIMNRDQSALPGKTAVRDFLESYVLRRKQTVVPVLRSQGGVAGMVSADDVDSAPLDAPIEQYVQKEPILHPNDPASTALSVMSSAGLEEVPVVQNDRLVGTLSLRDIGLYVSGKRRLGRL